MKLTLNIITPGLKFTSTHFTATAEIKEVREKDNEVDVILSPSDGHAWVEKGWNLEHLKWGFERKEYNPIVKELNNISVW